MDLLLIALLLAAVGAVVAVGLGKVGGGLAPGTPASLPPLERPVSVPDDLDRARFSLALRGYRMDQVDVVLDEARDLLAAKDAEIARLTARLPERPEPVDPGPAERPEPVDPEPAERTVREPDPPELDERPVPAEPTGPAAAPAPVAEPRP